MKSHFESAMLDLGLRLHTQLSSLPIYNKFSIFERLLLATYTSTTLYNIVNKKATTKYFMTLILAVLTEKKCQCQPRVKSKFY